ncbi:hypothetical protein FM103_03040 [Corynebacterium xerosis]|nr:hypothetical protein FM103_03040 [Corynebacterium xerosis]
MRPRCHPWERSQGIPSATVVVTWRPGCALSHVADRGDATSHGLFSSHG